MTRSCRGPLVVAALLGFWTLTITTPARAQPAKPDPVKITTVDGVELHGSFYGSPKKQAPVIICLHNIGAGETGTSKNWVSLAETLQPNFNVLLFDFRGHGKSKNIDPMDFWNMSKFPDNAKLVKGAPKKDTIDVTDFDKRYYPFLANDLAAVKAYLDRKNDNGGCNTASTILIGAEQGATLGAVWMNSEWHRYKIVQGNFAMAAKPAPDPEGKDIIACIWLSIAPKLGDSGVQLKNVLEIPVKQKATPTVFMYGDGDKSGKDLAVTMEKSLKEKGKKHEMIVSYPCEKTSLKGAKLIVKSLGTDGVINEFLSKNVLPTRGNEYYEREWRKSSFAWLAGPNPIPAREMGNDKMNLKYFNYYMFLGR